MDNTLNLGRFAIRAENISDIQVGAFYRRQRSTSADSNDSFARDTTTHGSATNKRHTFKRKGSVVSQQLTSVDSQSFTTSSQINDITSALTSDLSVQNDKVCTLGARIRLDVQQGRTEYVSVPTCSSNATGNDLCIDTQISHQSSVKNSDDETHESIVVNVNPAAYNCDSEVTISSQHQPKDDNHTVLNDYVPYTPKAPNVLKQTRKKTYPKQMPYDKIMSGVVFVMSGYENPRRGKLRDAAIEMGAKYQPAWNRFCTHLICAFKNTPKYKEVMAENGRIVREHWIQECSRQRQLIDWRNYKLGKYPYSDSEEEVDVDDLDYAIRTSYRIQTHS